MQVDSKDIFDYIFGANLIIGSYGLHEYGGPRWNRIWLLRNWLNFLCYTSSYHQTQIVTLIKEKKISRKWFGSREQGYTFARVRKNKKNKTIWSLTAHQSSTVLSYPLRLLKSLIGQKVKTRSTWSHHAPGFCHCCSMWKERVGRSSGKAQTFDGHMIEKVNS